MQKLLNPFVANESFSHVLALSKKFNKLPSEILGLKDSYAAYCLNEVSLILINALEEGKELNFEVKVEPKHYNNFADFYKNFQ